MIILASSILNTTYFTKRQGSPPVMSGSRICTGKCRFTGLRDAYIFPTSATQAHPNLAILEDEPPSMGARGRVTRSLREKETRTDFTDVTFSPMSVDFEWRKH